MPGRPPKPGAVQRLEGDRRDRINDQEPMPAVDAEGHRVVPPVTLDDGAAVVWNRLAPDLIKIGVLTHADVDAFRSYCEAVALNQLASERMQAEGLIDVPANGGVARCSAWFTAWHKTAETMLKYSSRFGLTPGDRRGIRISDDEKPKGDDPGRYLE